MGREKIIKKFCAPVERGGCGLEKPVYDFVRDRKAGTGYRYRCKPCNKRWKAMSREERAQFMPDNLAVHTPESKQQTEISNGDQYSWFFSLAPTICEREFCRVGREG